jgi:hypothetical protein
MFLNVPIVVKSDFELLNSEESAKNFDTCERGSVATQADTKNRTICNEAI